MVQTENQLQSLSVSEKLYTGFERYDTFVYRKKTTGMQCLALVSGTWKADWQTGKSAEMRRLKKRIMTKNASLNSLLNEDVQRCLSNALQVVHERKRYDLTAFLNYHLT